MKKLILMTSALTLVGGSAFAAAHGGGEISIGAEASVAYGNWDGAALGLSYGTSVTATLEGSAGDVSYGGSLTIEDADTVTSGIIWINTSIGKFTFDKYLDEEFDADVAGSGTADINYDGSFGDFGVNVGVDSMTQAWLIAVSTSMGGVNATAKFDSTNAWEISGDTTVGNVTVGATFDDASAWEVTAETTVSGLDVNASYDSASAWEVGVGGTSGAVTWDASYNSASEVAVNAEMGFGDTTVSIAYDQANAGGTGDDAEVVAMVEHTVGGLVLHAQVNDQSEYEVGASASFSF